MSGLGRGRRESKRLRMLRGKVRFSRRRRHSDRVSSHNFFTANRLDLRMAAELGPAVSKLERLALKGKSYLCYPFCASKSSLHLVKMVGAYTGYMCKVIRTTSA